VKLAIIGISKISVPGSSPGVPAKKRYLYILDSDYNMQKLNFVKLKLLKTKFFYGIPLAIFSWEIYFGVISGYLLAKFFSGRKTGEKGKIGSLIFDLGKWEVHLHHWLCGLVVLLIAFHMNFSLTGISFGFLGGFIFQGIFCYSDWYKIISKKDK
jgi:hypothetical protein